MLLKAAQWCKIVLNSFFHVLDLISIGVLFKRTAWNSKIRLLRRLLQENHYQTFFLGHPVYFIRSPIWELGHWKTTYFIRQTFSQGPFTFLDLIQIKSSSLRQVRLLPLWWEERQLRSRSTWGHFREKGNQRRWINACIGHIKEVSLPPARFLW